MVLAYAATNPDDGHLSGTLYTPISDQTKLAETPDEAIIWADSPEELAAALDISPEMLSPMGGGGAFTIDRTPRMSDARSIPEVMAEAHKRPGTWIKIAETHVKDLHAKRTHQVSYGLVIVGRSYLMQYTVRWHAHGAPQNGQGGQLQYNPKQCQKYRERPKKKLAAAISRAEIPWWILHSMAYEHLRPAITGFKLGDKKPGPGQDGRWDSRGSIKLHIENCWFDKKDVYIKLAWMGGIMQALKLKPSPELRQLMMRCKPVIPAMLASGDDGKVAFAQWIAKALRVKQ